VLAHAVMEHTGTPAYFADALALPGELLEQLTDLRLVVAASDAAIEMRLYIASERIAGIDDAQVSHVDEAIYLEQLDGVMLGAAAAAILRAGVERLTELMRADNRPDRRAAPRAWCDEQMGPAPG
jgi:hypothetical protein